MKKRKIALLLLLGCMVLIWSVRIVTLRKEKKASEEATHVHVIKEENIGEWVELGDNFLGDGYVNGYSIKVNGVRIMPVSDYAKEVIAAGYQPAEQEDMTNGMVCEVDISCRNTNNVEGGLSFMEALLVGDDFDATLHNGWFDAVNGYQDTYANMKLHENSEARFKLPYLVVPACYREKFGRKLTTERLYFLAVRYPDQIFLRVQ